MEDKHYQRRKTDLENSIYKVYDKIDDIESLIIDARAKKTLIADKMSTDNIYKSIIYMDKFFEKMNPEERREFIEQLISEVNVYENRTSEGQWLKSIKFRLPLLERDMEISLDNGTHVETVCLLSKLHEAKHHINVKLDMDELDLTSAEAKAT